MNTTPPPDQVRLLIADDHTVVRIGIRALLADESRISILGEAGRAEDCLQLARQLRPDVVLLDQRFPDGSGHDVCHDLKSGTTPPAVLMLTSFGDDPSLLACLSAGADGYLLKDLHQVDLARAILDVAAGRFVLDPSLARRAFLSRPASGTHTRPNPVDRCGTLSPQEVRVMDLLAAGCSNKEIAAHIPLSDGTVRNLLSSIYAKLNVGSRTEAVILWLQRPPPRP